jgi:hypothetical protein
VLGPGTRPAQTLTSRLSGCWRHTLQTPRPVHGVLIIHGAAYESASDARAQRVRTANLTAQDIELTTEDRQLNVPEVGAASAADEQTEQSSKGQLGNEKHMTPDPSTPAGATGVRAPFTL